MQLPPTWSPPLYLQTIPHPQLWKYPTNQLMLQYITRKYESATSWTSSHQYNSEQHQQWLNWNKNMHRTASLSIQHQLAFHTAYHKLVWSQNLWSYAEATTCQPTSYCKKNSPHLHNYLYLQIYNTLPYTLPYWPHASYGLYYNLLPKNHPTVLSTAYFLVLKRPAQTRIGRTTMTFSQGKLPCITMINQWNGYYILCTQKNSHQTFWSTEKLSCAKQHKKIILYKNIYAKISHMILITNWKVHC